MNQRPSNKDSDDWDTDPDFVRHMDEMDQRWGGNKRTVGSINMSELIDDVRREHKNLREKLQHPSKFGDSPKREFVTTFRNFTPTSATNFDEEQSSKLSTKEIKREVIRSETSSYVKESNGSVSSETIRETGQSPMKTFTTSSTSTTRKSPIPPLAPKPDFNDLASRLSRNRLETEPMRRFERDATITTDSPQQFKESISKSIFREEKSSSSTSAPTSKATSSNNLPQAFSKSIQERIDAFKKEFDDIEHKISKKSDISKSIKKMTNTDRKIDQDVHYVSRSNEKMNSNNSRSPSHQSPTNIRPTSASPSHSNNTPKANIKSLSERFETLGRESSDDFKRRMEERRREFFDRIKTQVRETRKCLDGFDIDDSDDDERFRAKQGSQASGMKQFVTKMNSSTSPLYGSQSSKLSSDSLSSQRPKVYTKRETTQEEVVSKFVKENDKVVHDETKRNVEHTSSCHGSSDENDPDEAEPTSIKYLDRSFKSSPQQRTQSPIDEIKRKVPIVEAEVKGAGLMARTLYDYQAVEEDELCFDVDDLITNIEKIDQGWYKGAITKDGIKRVGLFPANYVKLLNDMSEY